MNTIEAVTFDLWQTLVLDDRELGRARTLLRLEKAKEALGGAGYDFSIDHLREAYRRCYRTCREVHNQERDLTFQEQVDTFISYIDEGIEQRLDGTVAEAIFHWYAEAFFDFPPQVAPEALGVLEELKAKGYRLGMISNTGMTPGSLFRRYLAQHGILDQFQVLTFSDEVKLSKPSVEMFHMTLRALGTTSDRAVHVGDHIRNDVLGANRAGMRTVLLGAAEGQEPVADPHLRIGTLGELPQALAEMAG